MLLHGAIFVQWINTLLLVPHKPILVETKKSVFFHEKLQLRATSVVKSVKIVFSEISESIRFFWYPISIVYD